MKIFNGKKISEQILENLKKKIAREKKSPVLAIILIGENPESKLYIKNKKAAAENINLKVLCYNFKSSVKEKEVIKKIKDLNENSRINGIIVQLPLPEKFNTDKIINSIEPKKDVDGFHRVNRRLLKDNKPYFFPVLPSAILIALNSSPLSGAGTKNFKNKKIVALVGSDIFGETLRDFFKRAGIKIKYSVEEKNTSLSESADIIISVRGEPCFIKGEMIKENVILIDAGIRLVKGKLKGDVDRESVAEKVLFLTPVPGGIGPLTVALLLNNVFLSAKNYGFRSQ